MIPEFVVTAGTPVRTTAQFTASRTGGGLADPGVVTLKVRRGDGSTADLSGLVVRDSVGVYHADIPTSNAEAGQWVVVWAGDGTGPNVVSGAGFRVHRSPL